MSYIDVRGADGRLLFRYDPARGLVEMRVKGELHVVDLTVYAVEQAAVVAPTDPVEQAGRRNRRGRLANI